MMRNKLFLMAIAVGLGGVVFIDVCDLVFDCGCRSLWAGAASLCNIHNQIPPHCPWCERPFVFGGSAFAAAAGAQAALVFGAARLGLAARFALALLAFPVVGALVGIAQAWWSGYT